MPSEKSPRSYYSARTGGPSNNSISLEELRTLFFAVYKYLEANGYWVKQFGYHCIDVGFIAGEIGSDVDGYVTVFLQRPSRWPIANNIDRYTEDDLFDVIEFLDDHVSKPLKGELHDYGDCGMHWSEFDDEKGRSDYRKVINPPLARYACGYSLNSDGQILEIGPVGMSTLHDAALPIAEANIREKVKAAVDQFRRHGSNIADRRAAVRDLSDVLEFIRGQMKNVLLTKDETELFQLANNFGIRHFNRKQKMDYDQAVWLSWIFYHYLSTITAFYHLLQRQQNKSTRFVKSYEATSDDIRKILTDIKTSTVVSKRVHLIRAGREWKGLCPFHEERTPSFYVNDDKGFYHCFSCGAHGDTIQFLSQIDRTSYQLAANTLVSERSN